MTYIHSGIWNEDKTLRLPFIENARRSYRQLSLIEDAIVVPKNSQTCVLVMYECMCARM